MLYLLSQIIYECQYLFCLLLLIINCLCFGSFLVKVVETAEFSCDVPIYTTPESQSITELGGECSQKATMLDDSPPPMKPRKRSSSRRVILDSDGEDETNGSLAKSSYGRVLKSVKKEM